MVTLSAVQCRVIGVMLEKEVTTPEQYPMSLNGLTNACNQKSNREPVLSLSETEVQGAIDELTQRNLVSDQGAFSSRVAKYQHRFCNTEFGDLQLSTQQKAIICLLLLRGPQTPGELRTRSNRLADFNDVTEVESCLNQLTNLNEQVLVKKLAREPGKRESRFVHLFCDSPISDSAHNQDLMPELSATELSANEISATELAERVVLLEQQVALLTKKIAQLESH